MFDFLKRKKPAFTASLPPGRRVYAIGDIHGRLDLLLELSGLIAQDNRERGAAETDVILLGDLIDRGRDSAGVIRFAREAQPPWARLTAIKGNHEAFFLDIYNGNIDRLGPWVEYGGRQMLESFGVNPDLLDDPEANPKAVLAAMRAAIPPDVITWIEAMPVAVRVGDYLFVHAGIRPGVPLDEQLEEDALWIREDFLESQADHGATIVHGHTIVPKVVNRANRIGVDTGAYRSDRLTAVGLEGTERWFLQTSY
ncbi:metallophosphoesterase family protein [Sphingomonas sp. ID0503]|uniref:metallophosphoesterase family protein n=1 Tax=Sphingomonas sp. ID0503 TaxID=3399691 RepID=UPI003AFB6F4C